MLNAEMSASFSAFFDGSLVQQGSMCRRNTVQ